MSSDIRRVALVTGGSRGVGASTALAFARRGCDVALTYRNKVARADLVRQSIAALGLRSLSVECDITRRDDLDLLFHALDAWTDRLDVLVLNASGALERNLVAADAAYPVRINRDAQLAVVDAAVSRMPCGGVVVFVTSHWAHLYGRVQQLPAYESVASSKHAGEEALRDRQDDFARRGIRLLVVTGDLVEGTITPRLLERLDKGLFDRRQSMAGSLPTTEQMGEAIADAASNPSLASGSTIVVGGSLDTLPAL